MSLTVKKVEDFLKWARAEHQITDDTKVTMSDLDDNREENVADVIQLDCFEPEEGTVVSIVRSKHAKD